MADDGPSAKKARKSKVALITGITGQDELCREMVEADVKLVEKGDLTS